MTVIITAIADSFGRKSLLIIGALLMALAGWAFAVSDNPIVLTIAAVFGTISPSGKEVVPFLSLEQAILPQPPAIGAAPRFSRRTIWSARSPARWAR